jgi:hypothetical protein
MTCCSHLGTCTSNCVDDLKIMSNVFGGSWSRAVVSGVDKPAPKGHYYLDLHRLYLRSSISISYSLKRTQNTARKQNEVHQRRHSHCPCHQHAGCSQGCKGIKAKGNQRCNQSAQGVKEKDNQRSAQGQPGTTGRPRPRLLYQRRKLIRWGQSNFRRGEWFRFNSTFLITSYKLSSSTVSNPSSWLHSRRKGPTWRAKLSSAHPRFAWCSKQRQRDKAPAGEFKHHRRRL